jgi:hypothetical protein
VDKPKIRKAAERRLLEKLDQDPLFNLTPTFKLREPGQTTDWDSDALGSDLISSFSEIEPSKLVELCVDECLVGLRTGWSRWLPDNRIVSGEIRFKEVQTTPRKVQVFMYVWLCTEHKMPETTTPELTDYVAPVAFPDDL